MFKEKKILTYFIGWLILGLFICFIGITKADALVIDSSYLGYSTNTNFGVSSGNYISGNSYITVDQSNALNYYVVDICSTLNYGFSISNVSNISGNVSLYKVYQNLGSCNTTNYDGTLSRIYFKINQWSDAGNGNFGVIFNSRFNNITTYYGDNRVLNIYTSNEVDNTSDIINNQTNELNNSINNSTNTITGSIGDAENNINQNIDDMEQSIVDSNKETQDVIKDQFNSCYKNVLNSFTFETQTKNGITVTNNGDNTFTINGTATRYTAFAMQSLTLNPNSYYTLSGGINSNAVMQVIENKDNPVTQSNGAVTWYNTESSGTLYFVVFSGTTVNNVIIKPMLTNDNILHDYVAPQEEKCINRLDEQNDKLNDINGSLNNSDSSGATNDASNFFSNFTTDTFGLTSIITAPLNIINSITSSSCNDLNLPLPYLNNKYITLPCMNSIYTKYFGVFFTLYQTITFGIVSYWVIVRIFNQVKDFKNPEHDEIEVLDL